MINTNRKSSANLGPAVAPLTTITSNCLGTLLGAYRAVGWHGCIAYLDRVLLMILEAPETPTVSAEMLSDSRGRARLVLPLALPAFIPAMITVITMQARHLDDPPALICRIRRQSSHLVTIFPSRSGWMPIVGIVSEPGRFGHHDRVNMVDLYGFCILLILGFRVVLGFGFVCVVVTDEGI